MFRSAIIQGVSIILERPFFTIMNYWNKLWLMIWEIWKSLWLACMARSLIAVLLISWVETCMYWKRLWKSGGKMHWNYCYHLTLTLTDSFYRLIRKNIDLLAFANVFLIAWLSATIEKYLYGPTNTLAQGTCDRFWHFVKQF